MTRWYHFRVFRAKFVYFVFKNWMKCTMPIYRYESVQAQGCEYCRKGFEVAQRLSEPRLGECPRCGVAVRKVVVAASVGRSESNFDDRAKAAGFSKLKKIGKGEYEKQY